ncbi:MAG: response regulator transcription factor [Candidatus Izemoplasmatales bacterium]|jgi:two-component system alkaline phosphatase synthesis response regulator PhoP|nr:response regulator transcription factor [Candidatus Izemoplasmatales bacterium]
MLKPIVFSVEDEHNIQNVIKIALMNSGYDVICFDDAKHFFLAMENDTPDLVLLDIMLPDMDGYAIIQKMKENPLTKNIPIIIISAKDAEIDKVVGLDLGADDYVVKPFGVLELISRVKALLRRKTDHFQQDSFGVGELRFNPSIRECAFRGHKVTLTDKEFSLLTLLAHNPNQTLSRAEIMNQVWGYAYFGETRTVDVHIREIRLKLQQMGVTPDPIQTIRGAGYRFVL